MHHNLRAGPNSHYLSGRSEQLSLLRDGELG
jgi:hypothetical protein